MKLINCKTSADPFRVSRIAATACVVLSFERSSRRIGFFESGDALGREAVALEAHGIQAVAAGFARRYDFRKWRDVLRDHCVGSDIGVAADAAKLMHGAEGADRGVVFHGDVARRAWRR